MNPLVSGSIARNVRLMGYTDSGPCWGSVSVRGPFNGKHSSGPVHLHRHETEDVVAGGAGVAATLHAECTDPWK